MQLVLGKGGLDVNGKGKLNDMKLLHGVYNLQKWHEHEELKDIYLYTRKEKGLSERFEKTEEPTTVHSNKLCTGSKNSYQA